MPRRPCVANLDALESVPATLLTERLGRLSDARMRQEGEALAVAVDLPGLDTGPRG